MSVRDRIKMMEQMAKAKKEEGAAADERGRSPGGVSSVRSNASDSPRPLSKVRTSFVAIEKDGRIGLQRQASGDSIASGRKYSGDPELASSILQDHTRTNVSSPSSTRPELPTSFGSAIVSPCALQDAGPTSAPVTSEPAQAPSEPAAPSKPAFAGAIDPKPPSPSTDSVAQDTTSAGNSSPAGSAGPQPGRQEGLAEAAQIRQAPRRQDSKIASVWPPSQAAKENSVQPVLGEAQGKSDEEQGNSSGPNDAASEGTRSTPVLNGTSTAVKSSPPPTSAASEPKPAVKEAEPKPMAKAPQPAVKEAEPKSTIKAPVQAPKRSTTPPASQKPVTEKKTPSTVSPAFVKPRPKSPTRPVKLPASLTTHTAASGQRTKNGGPPSAHANRPQSRTSATSSGKSMKRSVSASGGRQRPSIGPPPKQTAKDHPVPKKEVKAPDESFLARMMRPTQASASKVADKIQVPTTPPRKVSTAAKKPPSAKTGQIRRVASRTMNSAASNGDMGKKDGPSTGKEVTRKVEHIPIAEETITVAKRSARDGSLKSSEGTASAKTVSAPTEQVAVPETQEAVNFEKHASNELSVNGDLTQEEKATTQDALVSAAPTESQQPAQEEW
ncbi:hypothetical protein BD289DRAFT_484448 [Coniella lustricola]|uniref:Uncharacterized protein n=1 Tax=Coniella lustricola TaxID=2025994 RepID=A0A2T3A206_9PEZI|nr:hypothetical protein BD289DRAFT_484448 [Coniella lustricola]